MQVPLLSGVVTSGGDFRTTMPVNLMPVPKPTGISDGYLRTAPGLVSFATGPGRDRGGIVWNGKLYRLLGGRLCVIDASGTLSDIAAITGGGRASFDYSFDRLAIITGGSAYYWDGGSLVQITDVDLGPVIDGIWIDGYFMYTDGQYLIVTDLDDPTSVDPTKYAASEIDPDDVKGLLKYRNEVYAFNRFTIEVFNNYATAGFPFGRKPGAMIPKGCVGTRAKCHYAGSIAWVGNGRNENVSVYLANGAVPVKAATAEVERYLAQYTDTELSDVLVEAVSMRLHQLLLVHLPRETLVYDAAASAAAEEPVWFFLSTGDAGIHPYRARGFVNAYGRWFAGDTEDGRVGVLDETVSTQYDEIAGWQFDTPMLYNRSKGAIVNSVELIGTPGRGLGLSERPTVFMSWSPSGEEGSFSDERQASMGAPGQTSCRVQWRPGDMFDQYQVRRFRGANRTPVAWARLEAELEPLAA